MLQEIYEITHFLFEICTSIWLIGWTYRWYKVYSCLLNNIRFKKWVFLISDGKTSLFILKVTGASWLSYASSRKIPWVPFESPNSQAMLSVKCGYTSKQASKEFILSIIQVHLPFIIIHQNIFELTMFSILVGTFFSFFHIK